ncbi:MAG: DNA repair protein RecO [Eubacteriales bacterium]|nr:DNA repair protein RecO [Eubacteriales bacterium]
MPSITTEGVVLRYANYREHDRMLTVISPEYGRIDALSRGCRRPKSPLMPASELFVSGEFVFYQSHDHFTLTSCTLRDTFYPLRLEPYRLTCASYQAALCAAAVQPSQEAEGLYRLLLRGLYLLAYDDRGDALEMTSAFLLLFADQIGYRPRLTRCAHCRVPLPTQSSGRFDIEAGGLCCEGCSSRSTYPLSAAQIQWMAATLKDGLSAKEKSEGAALFELLRRYVESRIEFSPKVSKLLP